MKQFKAEHGAVHVNSGQVQLTAEQARPRLHALTAVKVNKAGDGTYQVNAPIQFKKGETFGFDGEVGKNGVLSDPDAEQLAEMESADAKIAAATHKLQKQFEEELAKAQAAASIKTAAAVADAEDVLIAALTPETAARVRAELHPAAPGT